MNFRKIIEKQIASNKLDLQDHEAIVEALRPYDGKMIDQKLAKHLPEGFTFKWEAGSLGYVRKTRNTSTHLIAYSSHPYVQIDKIDGFDGWACAGAKERIEKLQAILYSPERLKLLNETFTKLDKAFDTVCTIARSLDVLELSDYKNPAYYYILEEIGIPTRLISDIIYNKLK